LTAFLDAMSARQLSVFLTIAGAGAVAIFQLAYTVCIQGWGTPLP
jgi:hypothetical protein